MAIGQTEMTSIRETPTRRWGVSRRLIRGAVCVLGVCLLLGFVVPKIIFHSILAWYVHSAAPAAGVELSFESARGSLWTGRFDLRGITAIDAAQIDAAQAPSDFNVRVERAQLDLSVLDLLQAKLTFDRVDIRGLRGWYHLIMVEDGTRMPEMVIRELRIQDVDLDIEDKTRPSEFPARCHLVIDQVNSKPLRTAFAVHDLLYRTNVTGRIDESEFEIESRRTPDTHWRVTNLPTSLIRGYLKSPWNWITDGTVDLEVSDRWQLDQTKHHTVSCPILLRNVAADVPEHVPSDLRAALAPAVALLVGKNRQLSLRLDLELTPDRIEAELGIQPVDVAKVLSRTLSSGRSIQAR